MNTKILVKFWNGIELKQTMIDKNVWKNKISTQ